MPKNTGQHARKWNPRGNSHFHVDFLCWVAVGLVFRVGDNKTIIKNTFRDKDDEHPSEHVLIFIVMLWCKMFLQNNSFDKKISFGST